ncbi:hypothetical protein QFW80_12410 [Luteimonas sp. M1R5S18]|uniref:Dolichyl-phosphate-mannose-protein mannosyltransferase n=1 Tax=Luteimonas rhizosphaericola TaxID=3042024 RepID=A0ABT6JKW2_9GAMM|nr:hypothetical protein [Luteimonas rhizosphaericola]MDH5831317.1 hypothetical protein [Luteimonas rhizosphaericola]
MLALLARLYYVETVVIDGPIRGDAAAYFSYASNLAEHGVFSSARPGSDEPLVPDSYRDPGYPLLVSTLMRLLGGEAWYPLLLQLQAVLGAATVGLALALGRRWMATRWLAAAGILMALWPHSIAITSYFLTETLAGFLSVLWLWLLVTFGRSWRGGLLAGLVAGTAGLVSAVLLPAATVVAVLLWITGKAGRGAAVALLLGSLLLPVAWAVRGMQIEQAGTVTSTSSGRASQNLIQGSWPEYHDSWRACIYGDPGACEVQKRINDEIALLHATPAAGLRGALSRMQADPLKYARWYATKPYLLWDWSIRIGQGDVFVSPATASAYRTNAFYRASSAIAYALNPWLFFLAAAFCFGVALRWRLVVPDAVALAAFLLYVTGVYWVFQSEPRYSIPFRSLELIAAVGALMAASSSLQARRRDETL